MELDDRILRRLRDMARERKRPSQMLREIMRMLAPAAAHRIVLIRYMMAAFRVPLGPLTAIGGWGPHSAGEITDARLDEWLLPEISRRRAEWEALAAE